MLPVGQDGASSEDDEDDDEVDNEVDEAVEDIDGENDVVETEMGEDETDIDLVVDQAEEVSKVVVVKTEDKAFVDELAGSDVADNVADDWVSLCGERCAVELAGVDFGRSWLEGIEASGRFASGFTAGSFFGSYS
jgi:hypothetical protein